MDATSIAAQKHIEAALGLYKVESLGDLPKEIRSRIRREAREIAFKDVFGADHKKDKQGNPVEQGLGSYENPTKQSIDAYIKSQTDKRHRDEPEEGFEENVKKMRQRLAEVDAKRKALRAAEDDDDA
jgi:hypothetical protein